MAQKIIIDTDPGKDDAVAILVALSSPEDFDVLGLTSVAGNVPIDRTTRNCLTLIELAERHDVAVHRGAQVPLGDRRLITAEHVHGDTGIDGLNRPLPKNLASDVGAVDFLVNTIMSVEAVTICALGPLTNIARALEHEPAIAGRVSQIVMMGGACFEGGNITPSAEFNIYVDPLAAAKVFGSGMRLVLMPLDVTHQAITTSSHLSAFADLGNRAGKAVAAMLEPLGTYDQQRHRGEGAPLHDPTVIAYLLDPTLFRGRFVNVEVETTSALTMGATVCDWWGVTDRQPNCQVMRELDDEAFFRVLFSRIGRLP